MQAFALQKAIGMLDPEGECIIINHWTKKPDVPLFIRKPSIKTLKGFIYLKGARRAQSRFLSAYAALKPDAPLLKEELGDFCRDYDLIFTGSDQVWNPVFTPGEHPLRFLLDFVEDDAKKVAYAPSFGTRTLDEDYADEFRCLLPKFSHPSVRESAGQEIIRKLTGLCPPVVADPTLLMNCDDWKSYASKPGIKDYIFLYEKDHNDELESFARCLSSKTGLKVIRKSMPNTHSKAITSRLVSALELFFLIMVNENQYRDVLLSRCRTGSRRGLSPYFGAQSTRVFIVGRMWPTAMD